MNETQDYSINTFFWFFESRKDPSNAPLSIWLNGGPGTSSMVGLLSENGPCMVNDDSNSTYLNPWSWNNEVNMLYIDQPNQVGFSWDKLIKATINRVSDEPSPFELIKHEHHVPPNNSTFQAGTFSSQDGRKSANGTQNAARALWHFAQVWFQEFPDYKPNNDAISLFAESYGGRYGPAIVSFFEEQNERILNLSINDTGNMHVIHLDTLGIVNGCIDLLTQELAYLTMAYNNTYGIQAIDSEHYLKGIEKWTMPDTGCRDEILYCQSLAAQGDPDFTGSNETVNHACQQATYGCRLTFENIYSDYSGRNYYDIAALDVNPFPPNYYIGYLANQYVQAALGVPVNFTQSTPGVHNGFEATGDYSRVDIRGGYLRDLGYLLDSGIKVALMYGDRDYACNWIGGEEVSLAVNYSQSEAFRAAGYANISVNSSYIGGQVRQHGNFSFSRVFQAGHEVPAYQPETAYQIFTRAIFGKDIATGVIDTVRSVNYSTNGSSTTFEVKNQDLGPPTPQFYVLALWATCTEEQIESIRNGTGLVQDYILVDDNQSHLFPGNGEMVLSLAEDEEGKSAQRNGAEILRVSCWGILGMMFLLVGSLLWLS